MTSRSALMILGLLLVNTLITLWVVQAPRAEAQYVSMGAPSTVDPAVTLTYSGGTCHITATSGGADLPLQIASLGVNTAPGAAGTINGSGQLTAGSVRLTKQSSHAAPAAGYADLWDFQDATGDYLKVTTSKTAANVTTGTLLAP